MTGTHEKTHAAALAKLAGELAPAQEGDALFVVVTHADGRFSLLADQVTPPQVALAAAALLQTLLDRARSDGFEPPLHLLLAHAALTRLGGEKFADGGAGRTLQ